MTKKTAFITGSTSGIGLGIARALKKENYNIMLHGIEPPEKVSSLSKELNANYYQTDLTDNDSITKLMNDMTSDSEHIDVVINNAGIQHISPIENFSIEKWNLILQLNLTAAFIISKTIIPIMKQQKFGRIINIASAHGLVASPYKAAYVAAKHGLIGLTKVIALECAGFGITCNAICPGYVLTALVKKQIPEVAKEKNITEEQAINEYFLGAHARKEFVTIEEVAAAVSFIASDQTASITGISLPIEAGWTAA